MAALTAAQPPEVPPDVASRTPVLDTDGQPLQRDVEYYILPDRNNQSGGDGGGLTLVDRNASCPLYVGQEDHEDSTGLPVTFTPFFQGETVIRENSDFRVSFSAVTICIQSTAWRLAGQDDKVDGRRLIVTGGDSPGYFRIQKEGETYNLGWCPTDVCPLCRFACGKAGILIDNNNNGKRLLALDGPVLPVVFKRV